MDLYFLWQKCGKRCTAMKHSSFKGINWFVKLKISTTISSSLNGEDGPQAFLTAIFEMYVKFNKQIHASSKIKNCNNVFTIFIL